MSQKIQIQLRPEEASSEVMVHELLSKHIGLPTDSFTFYWRKRSIDARKRDIKINGTFEIFEKGEVIPDQEIHFPVKDVSNKQVIHIIGAGPAGLYAALKAIELGFKPVLFERGKDVKARRRDLARLNKEQIVNPESNYCFGEGGAGTYSDGKLYTRSKKRGDVQQAMEWLVYFGADKDILVDAHTHN